MQNVWQDGSAIDCSQEVARAERSRLLSRISTAVLKRRRRRSRSAFVLAAASRNAEVKNQARKTRTCRGIFPASQPPTNSCDSSDACSNRGFKALRYFAVDGMKKPLGPAMEWSLIRVGPYPDEAFRSTVSRRTQYTTFFTALLRELLLLCRRYQQRDCMHSPLGLSVHESTRRVADLEHFCFWKYSEGSRLLSIYGSRCVSRLPTYRSPYLQWQHHCLYIP